MAAPFGFSVGDFIAVGQLIQQVTVELRENGESASEYQHLIIELESLDRALKQLYTLRPAKHELLQLNAIRATALLCQIPLREFLAKISKFDQRLGTWNSTDQRFKGFHRRMQWRLAYQDDVKELRTKLGSHVATISLLLMTQTVSSIVGAETDLAEVACEFRDNILAHRRLLEDVKVGVDTSIARHVETKLQLESQAAAVRTLDQKAGQTIQQLHYENVLIQEVKLAVSITEERTRSILAIATDALSQAALGLLTLRDIARQLYNLTTLITKFTDEIKETIALLMGQFARLYQILQHLETSLAKRICLPIVQFTDALGDSMALPFQVCAQWKTFRLMLDVVFDGRPGKSRVDMGNFLIMHAAGGRALLENNWSYAVREGDHLQMSMVLNDLLGIEDTCPFPSCKASLHNAELENDGKVCAKCGRWSVMRKMEGASTTPNNSRRTYSRRALEGVTADYEDWELGDSIVEDIELYRYVHATIGVSTADIQQIIDAAEITEEHADIDGRPEKGSANALNPLDHKPRPIKFKDAIGRKFSFPFQLCATWAVSTCHRLSCDNGMWMSSDLM